MTIPYRFGGLLIESDIPLRSVALAEGESNGRADVKLTAERGAAPQADRHLFAWPGRYGLRLGGHGDKWLMQSKFDGSFLIERDGSALHIISEAEPDAAQLVDVLVRRVLPRVAMLRGKMAIHAAAFANSTTGILVVGPSGAGKSTLSAAMSTQKSWTVLSDDISILERSDEPQLHSGVTDICVWPETSKGLDLERLQCSELDGYEGKVRFDPGSEARIESARLRHIISLNPVTDEATPILAPLALADCLAAIAPQIIKFNPPHDAAPAQNAATLATLLPIVSNAKSWRLTYPKSYDAMPRMIELIQNVSASA